MAVTMLPSIERLLLTYTARGNTYILNYLSLCSYLRWDLDFLKTGYKLTRYDVNLAGFDLSASALVHMQCRTLVFFFDRAAKV
jgi:hypothetical protein